MWWITGPASSHPLPPWPSALVRRPVERPVTGGVRVVPIEILFGAGTPGGLEVALGLVVEIKLGCAHAECFDVHRAMPVAALQVAVVL